MTHSEMLDKRNRHLAEAERHLADMRATPAPTSHQGNTAAQYHAQAAAAHATLAVYYDRQLTDG